MAEALVRIGVSVGDFEGIIVLGSIVVSELDKAFAVRPIFAVGNGIWAQSVCVTGFKDGSLSNVVSRSPGNKDQTWNPGSGSCGSVSCPNARRI